MRSAQKVVIYGPEGIGKSTFASKFPNPVFIDTEGSTKHMDVARLPKPSSWSMLLEDVRHVKGNPGICSTLVIDTADWAEQPCSNEICAKAQKEGIEDFGYGKGYTYLSEEFGRLLSLLEEIIEMGVNVVFTAHAQMRKFEQPDEMGTYDRWETKLQKKTAPLLKEWADMLLFANYKTFVVKTDEKKNKVQGGKRVMYTSHHPCWDAKNRHDLSPELDFSYTAISHCIPTITAAVPEAKPEVKAEGFIVVEEPVQEQPVMESTEDQAEIPKALTDLIEQNNVTIKEIQLAVASRGYYPADTPIGKYDPKFITGVLIAAWPQVYQMVQRVRDEEKDKEKAPF